VVYLLAPQVKRGVLFTREEAEGKRLRNPFDTITEGVGLNRLTANFAAALVDDAVQVTDQEAVEMGHYLLRWAGGWGGGGEGRRCCC
jgi:cysteine synthase A